MEIVFAYLTAADKAQAERIAEALVTAKLAACVTFFGGANSFYYWDGKLEKSSEVVLFAKTLRSHTEAFLAAVKALHAYACPAVVFLPVVAGNPEYLEWVAEACQMTELRGK